jgi:hypothetical protein
MFEAYRIGVRIGVVDATEGGILRIAAQFTTAQKKAQALLDTIRKINEANRAATGWGAGNGAADSYDRARRSADQYANSAARANRANGSSSGGNIVTMAAFAAGRGGSGSGGMLPISNRAPQLALPGSGGGSGGTMQTAGWGFGGGRGGSGSGGMGGYGPMGAMFGGALVEHAGKDMFGMLGGPIDEAMKYQQAVTKFTLYGNGDKVNAEAVKFAKSMNIIGTSMTDAMENMTEAQGVFRESGLTGSAALDGAKLAAPLLSKIAFATSGLDGDSQAKMHTQSLAMLRFIEMRGGLKDATTFNSIADAGWKAIRSSGGNINWEQMRQFMARGGVAAQGLTNTALFGKLEPVIGELKGSTAGNAWMTSYNRLVGGVRVPNQIAHLLADNGIWDASKIEWNSQGGIKRFNGNPLRDMKTFSSDPVAFYEKNILPMYTKMGVTSAAEKGRENTLIFGRTGGAMFSLIDRQLAAIHRSVDAQKKTLGVDASVDAVKGTAAGQLLNYHKQMETLQTQLGLVILPMLIRGLQWLNPLLQKMGDWIGAHSTLAKGLVIIFGAIAGLALVGGSIIAIAGGFSLLTGVLASGGIAGLIGGVGSAFAALTPLVGAFLAAYVAWKAGTAVGNAIYKHTLEGNKAGDMLGSGIAHTLAFFGNKDAQAAVAQMNKAQTVQVNSTINLDGRQIGQAVTTHQMKAATGPQTGMSGFDSSMMPTPIGVNGSW